ncbi:hypothetical protein BTM36_06935, partial [Herbaspirillum sp. VT-16-41]
MLTVLVGNLQIINIVVLMVLRMRNACYLVVLTVTLNKNIVFADIAFRYVAVASDPFEGDEIIFAVRPVTLLVITTRMGTDNEDIGVSFGTIVGVGITTAGVVVNLRRAVGFRHKVALDGAIRAIRRQPDMYVTATRHAHA